MFRNSCLCSAFYTGYFAVVVVVVVGGAQQCVYLVVRRGWAFFVLCQPSERRCMRPFADTTKQSPDIPVLVSFSILFHITRIATGVGIVSVKCYVCLISYNL
jgi:hypothetical protein